MSKPHKGDTWFYLAGVFVLLAMAFFFAAVWSNGGRPAVHLAGTGALVLVLAFISGVVGTTKL